MIRLPVPGAALALLHSLFFAPLLIITIAIAGLVLALKPLRVRSSINPGITWGC